MKRSHRPLPRVDIPLLRNEIRSARIRKAFFALLIAIPVIGISAFAGWILGGHTKQPSEHADSGTKDAILLDASSEIELDAATDGGNDQHSRVELASEHVVTDTATPITQGATLRKVFRFGNAPAFRNALLNAGLSREEAVELESALTPVLDFRRCQPDHKLIIERDTSQKLVRFEYRSSPTNYIAMTLDAQGHMQAHRIEVPIEHRRIVKAIRVTTTIADALAANHLGRSLLSTLIDTFQGRADFSRNARPNDVFRIIVEEERVHGELLRYGTVYALMYDGSATGHFEAYRFQPQGERAQFYDVEGRELKGGWLTTPCRYDRISSRFDMHRLHPILRRVQPHNGIDFAAPTGTTVWAAASGTIIWSGPKGPNGNLVGISHGDGYQTYYAHLHHIQAGIVRGAHVEQHQTIGQVGTTGRSTGPHLHFGLKRGSQFVDPATILNGRGRQLSTNLLRTFQNRMHALQRELRNTRVEGTSASSASTH